MPTFVGTSPIFRPYRRSSGIFVNKAALAILILSTVAALAQAPDFSIKLSSVSLRVAQQAKTSPQRAAQVILDAVDKNKARVLIGADVKAMDLLVRLTGSGHDRLLAGPVMNRVKHAVHRLLTRG